jgi:2,3-bisphosphoglycerate-dependent phosphoglycerate mutase
MKGLIRQKYNRVFIVRHGESIWNHDSKFTGWTNIPLTKNGKKEAGVIAEKLKSLDVYPDVFFSSVLNRAIETTNIIKSNFNENDPLYTSWRLNEKHYGNLEGLPRQKIRDDYGDKFTKMMRSNFYMKPPLIREDIKKDHQYPVFRNCYFDTIKNGESKENVMQRFIPYFQNDVLYSFVENKVPLVVTHKHCLRVLMKHYLKIDDEKFEDYQIKSRTIVELKFDDDFKYLDNHLIKY